jgi:hypothetical protein
VVHGDEALLLLAPLEEREVKDPAELEAIAAGRILDGPSPADLAEGLESRDLLVGDDEGRFPAPGMSRLLTSPPAATAFLRTSDDPSRAASVRSRISRGTRRSGLSEPYFSMAST